MHRGGRALDDWPSSFMSMSSRCDRIVFYTFQTSTFLQSKTCIKTDKSQVVVSASGTDRNASDDCAQ